MDDAERVPSSPPPAGVDGGGRDVPRDLEIRRAATRDLSSADLGAIRALLDDAFAAQDDPFGDLDWQHALGGIHVLASRGGRIVAHAALVERTVRVDRTALRTGYVEAVATATGSQGAGIGSVVMEAVGRLIREGFELGALGTGRHSFYARLGWEMWLGRSNVLVGDAVEATPDDDGFIMVLRTPTTPPLDLRGPIVCDWRPGDVW